MKSILSIENLIRYLFAFIISIIFLIVILGLVLERDVIGLVSIFFFTVLLFLIKKFRLVDCLNEKKRGKYIMYYLVLH